MGELDYQMALLLQHKFEQDYKSSRNHNTSDEDEKLARLLQEQYEKEAPQVVLTAQGSVVDELLAKELQEQFEHEVNVEKPSSSLTYSNSKVNVGASSSKSLIDPSWELVDPTPDIHGLFIAFNQRFFWNKLLAVCVSWSKRMTSCAGICSYSSRGGMCSITLSEPLLKLRPRKDLVETLLHEMIHAYLFVTHNNKDRDGHGPEFHNHMYRINRETGTNITVYHNFYDEVRLYKQHWWKCDGPCQHRKPFLGIVRRATNRAPGPNDRWWAQHLQTCGGTFVKVKEPEKVPKKGGKKENNATGKKMPDIRNYLPTLGKNGSEGGNSENNVVGLKDLSKPDAKTEPTSIKNVGSTNIVGFKDISNNYNSSATFKNVPSSSGSNIVGFNNLNQRAKGLHNSTSTIVVTKTKTKTESEVKTNNTLKPTLVKGNPTGTVPSDNRNDEFLTVRKHWEGKFQNPVKRKSPEPTPSVSKLAKTSSADDTECPVCNKKIPSAEINEHLDICLEGSAKEERKQCAICSESVVVSNFDRHVEECLLKVRAEEETGNKVTNATEHTLCLACNKEILKSDLNAHLEECMSEQIFTQNKDLSAATNKTGNFDCPFCSKSVEEKDLVQHIDKCVLTADHNFVESLIDDDF